VDTMPEAPSTPRAARRRHDDALKQRVLDECRQPGASVARVALSHGLNANLVHKCPRRPNFDLRCPR
jgi:transposase